MSKLSLKELIQQQFDAEKLELPVFNRVALELQRMKNDETVTLDGITNVIMKDQSLASNILRVANSSFYGGLNKVETINNAVLRLGLERVSNLSMVASQLQAHSSKVKIIADHMPALWKRSFATSVGARWVATESGYQSNAEEFFLAALMHDIGELFLLKVLEQFSVQQDQQLPLTEALIHEILESLHAEMGYKLMLKWELPEPYALVARDHHLQELDESNVLLIVTRLLDIVSQKLGIGQSPEPDIVLAATPEAQTLGLKDLKLAELEIMLEDAVDEAEEML